MLYWEQSDECLVLLTLAGQTKAYEALVLRYETAVIASANRVLKNRPLAEDAAQDAFVTAWMKLNLLREPAKFAPWICRIAVNCAKHLVLQYSGYSSLNDTAHALIANDGDPLWQYVFSEKQNIVRDAVSNLPEKVGQVIRLHYFEDLSVAEIAEKMGISVGTVKSQLHDGRKKLRKELCAMNEEMNDTLVQRVMKKVEELKLWKWKKNKNGFVEVYREVLREVEDLPESCDKYRALADVLTRGYWWIPGEVNDALLDRIRDAAEKGRNEDVLLFVTEKESHNFYGKRRLEFLRDVRIPQLEKGGFFKASTSLRCKLADACFHEGEEFWAEGREICESILRVADSDPSLRASALAILSCRNRFEESYQNYNPRTYSLNYGALELRPWNNMWRQWSREVYFQGWLPGVDSKIDQVFAITDHCDGYYFVKDLSVGQKHVCSDGTVLVFEADDGCVETPCGIFENCQVWSSIHEEEECRTWFKEGVGIVKKERRTDGSVETRVLSAYSIIGGSGLLPLAEGNFWEYTAGYNPEIMVQRSRTVVSFLDHDRAILSFEAELCRKKYDENSWRDMMLQVRDEYCFENEDGSEGVCDVYYPMQRAEALAKTPIEKIHTRMANTTARRILETDPVFNPNHTATGRWNFFLRIPIFHKNGTVQTAHDGWNHVWCFEWKHYDSAKACKPLLYNHVYTILQENTSCVYSDSWKPGVRETKEIDSYGDMIKTEIVCEDVGAVTVKAGTFEGCMKVTLNSKGFSSGFDYLGGQKEYYFAPTIGIIKTVNYYDRNRRTAVYELVRYVGTGEGYFPMADGMTRRYEALELSDGYEAYVDYVFAEGERGLVLFADHCGICHKLGRIEDYGSMHWEREEERLWNSQKFEESRMIHDANNFHLLCRFLGRWGRTFKAPERSHELYRYRMRIMEALSETGVPDAWKGYYARICLNDAGALFAIGRKEDGYEALERCFDLYDAWGRIPKGTSMAVGDDTVYGGARIVKGEGMLVLADGSKQLPPHDLFDHSPAEPYNAMTAKRGWEWLRTVEEEERFKGLIEKARALKEKYR